MVEIRRDSFKGCIELQEIKLPNALEIIYEYAFAGNSLKALSLPETLTEIQKYAFSKSESLRSIIIPKSVKTFDEYAFQDCPSLEEVTLLCPITIWNIFYGKNNVKILNLGTGIKKFTDSFFKDIEKTLEVIYVPFKKGDYYKKRIPEKFHDLIKELPK